MTGHLRSVEVPAEVVEPAAVVEEIDGTAQDGTANGSRPGSAATRLHRLTVDSLAQLATQLEGIVCADVVLVLPTGSALVIGDPQEFVAASKALSGTCVAASPVPFGSPSVSKDVERAVAGALGGSMSRCHPFPHALLGTAAELRSLLGDMDEANNDADRLTSVLFSDRHDVVLDTISRVFHVLDGTGTDVAIVAGRAHAGGEQPLVLVDLVPNGRALALARNELADDGGRDLGRLLRYDDAADLVDIVGDAGRGGLVAPLWTSQFCATIIRAAEAAAVWTNEADDPAAEVGVWLDELSPCLFSLFESDLDQRIMPRVKDRWAPPGRLSVAGAMVLRYQAGGRPTGLGNCQDDAANFRGSMRLNDGYQGGGLVAPRQGWDDTAMKTGAIAIWPSEATHPHYTAPVTAGVKYSLAIWWQTARRR